MVGKLAKRMMPLYVIFLVLGFLLGGGWCYSLIHTPIRLLTTPGSTFMGLCWLGIFLYFIADLITYLVWRHRALAAAQRGEFLPTRGCHKLLCVVVGVVVVGLIYWLATERLPGMRFMVGGMLLAYVVIFGAVNGTKQVMKRKKVSATLNRTITICVDISLAVVLVGTVNMVFLQGVRSGAFSMEEQLEAPLSASELTGEEEEKYLTTVSVDQSLFLDRQEVRCRTGFDQAGQLPWMDYTLVKIHLSWLYHACFRELCRDKEEWVATYVDENLVYAQYVAVDPTPWGAEKVYQLNLRWGISAGVHPVLEGPDRPAGSRLGPDGGADGRGGRKAGQCINKKGGVFKTPPFLSFWTGFEQQCGQKPEENGSGHTPGGG